ncbi:ATP-dependent 6-phosphofructokinase [Marivirga tractuosa]|uniref:ATP-dependent 6-phosphofructokinase n=1 Tax=Marivirga tractuosa (strain ATCC 23168 / DSM 4126 / NBRC 15989 / NCIMB 1408 / VKM B-1430 / H-43) TaxID=643867 RepID=E4TU36_MARTH|nr:6-phosphofructokinase [Marivirga tractuosa]ADR23058.1 6-phosphofructokinase [Marivirga tractuosa DSM 4126]BDD16268.1 ATP-dependent 6-phosphofructokinase [Marivirga tractuosa]
MNKINRIGVFTSGGDAPGMNAAIRAVVRAGIYYNKEIVGIYRGYEGMIEGDFEEMDVRSVANILQRGGTMLKSARSKEFRTPEGRKKAFEQLKKSNIDALIGIGGDGSFTGMHHLYLEHGMPYICIPGTIDNDIPGTDYTIGYDTATNTAVEAIDKIRDTALSHNRLFFIEVMGRDSGYIAISSGIAGGAVSIIIPEEETSIDELVEKLNKGGKKNKTSSLVIVAEGGKSGSAMEIAEKVKEKSSYFDTKVTILGHLQRGGTPTYFDRLLASKMGVAAIEGLDQGKTDAMVGIRHHDIIFNKFDDIMNQPKDIHKDDLRIAKILSI